MNLAWNVKICFSIMFGSFIWEALEFVWTLLRWTLMMIVIIWIGTTEITFSKSLLESCITFNLLEWIGSYMIIRLDSMMSLLQKITLFLHLSFVFIKRKLKGAFFLITFRIASKFCDSSCNPLFVILDTRYCSITLLFPLLILRKTCNSFFSFFCNHFRCVSEAKFLSSLLSFSFFIFNCDCYLWRV